MIFRDFPWFSWLVGDLVYRGDMRWEAKICAKYAQICAKICATLKMGPGTPYHIIPALLIQKMMIFFWSGRSDDHFKNIPGTFLIFFQKILVFWGVQFFWRSKKYSSEAYYFDESSPKNCKICANMRKYAQHIFPLLYIIALALLLEIWWCFWWEKSANQDISR